MRPVIKVGAVGLCVAFCASLGALRAQDAPRELVVQISQADGKVRGARGLMEARPEDLLSTPRVNVTFLVRPDVKDEAGRVVTGVGLTAWTEEDGARVWVFSVIPKDGVPNEYYGTPQGMANTCREPIAEFVMKRGDVRKLHEMDAWNFEPLVLALIERSR